VSTIDFSLTIPHIPVPFARCEGNGKRRFTPDRQRSYMEYVRILARVAWKRRPLLTGAVKVDVVFFMPRPKYHFDKLGVIKKQYEHTPHIVKPDRDNLVKLLYDCLSGIVYKDDCQINDGLPQKVYAGSNNRCRTVVTVTYEEHAEK